MSDREVFEEDRTGDPTPDEKQPRLAMFMRSLLAFANFLVGLTLFAVTSTLTKEQVPLFLDDSVVGKEVADSAPRFLPMLIGSVIAYPLILWMRKRPNPFSFKWLIVAGVLLLVASKALDGAGLVPWPLVGAMALMMATIQSSRALRSDMVELSGPKGDKYFVWADLGYGLGTFLGIVLWANDLAAIGGFQAAIWFSIVALLVVSSIDFVVARRVTWFAIDAEESGEKMLKGDLAEVPRAKAKNALMRWALLVPLLAVAVQAVAMRQSDRFDEFFSYMAFDIGTVVAATLLATVLTIKIGDTPFIPSGYVSAEKPGAFVSINLVIGLVAGFMVSAFVFEHLRFGLLEKTCYFFAGAIFEATWLILLPWIAACSRELDMSQKISVSGTIGLAIVMVTTTYIALSWLKFIHPAIVSFAALGVCAVLVVDRKARPTRF